MGDDRSDWPAPTAAHPVHAVAEIPGSKSATNRALVLAALANGPSTISGALLARDTRLMIAGLQALGISIDLDGTDVHVVPGPLTGHTFVDCGLAGTVMRFLPAVAALAKGDVRFDGDPRARVRPMAAVVDALRELEVAVDDDGRRTLPFTVHGTGSVEGGLVDIDASASSQFVSALLLASPRFDFGVTIHHVGDPLPSMPHIDMTVSMLREHGVEVTTSTDDPTNAWWTVEHHEIAALDRVIEPDLSNAAPFLAAAMVTAGTVTIPRWPAMTHQAGDHLRTLLAQMGASVALDDAGLTVRGPQSIRGLVADLHDVGELTPVLAAIAALAETPSEFSGISHLRGHETDRLAALATEINALGGNCEETADGLRITPAPLHGGLFHTYDDHRMATAGAVIGLRVPGITVEDIGTTSKTLPDFAAMWAALVGGQA